MNKAFVSFLLPAVWLACWLAAAPLYGQTVDKCHVYVIDEAKAEKLLPDDGAWDEAALEKVTTTAITTFPDFLPDVGEERLTTKRYRLPGTDRTITVSVFYTDESLASPSAGPEYEVVDTSIQLAVAVGPAPCDNALTATGAAVAEMTSDGSPRALRTKLRVKVGRRRYLVGAEWRREAGPTKQGP